MPPVLNKGIPRICILADSKNKFVYRSLFIRPYIVPRVLYKLTAKKNIFFFATKFLPIRAKSETLEDLEVYSKHYRTNRPGRGIKTVSNINNIGDLTLQAPKGGKEPLNINKIFYLSLFFLTHAPALLHKQERNTQNNISNITNELFKILMPSQSLSLIALQGNHPWVRLKEHKIISIIIGSLLGSCEIILKKKKIKGKVL